MAEEKIKEIEKELARTQINKATAKHVGLLRARLVKLKSELLGGGKGGGGGGVERGFDVAKSGDTRIGLVGFPSVGKSTLLTKLTGTESLAAAYEFTTLTAIPGTLHYRGARIQVLDLPGIIEGAKDGKGRGRQVIAAARTCNVIMIVLDAAKPIATKKKIEYELEGFGIRLNKERPDIRLKKKDKGGVTVRMRGEQKHLSKELVKSICGEYRMVNADVDIRKENASVEDVVDVLSGKAVYMPCLYLLNKIDKVSIEEIDLICSHDEHFIPISAREMWNFDTMLEELWDRAKMLRVYTKPRGHLPDYAEPVVLHARRPTVKDFCNAIHKAIAPRLKYAWVWGSSAKFQPQKVGLSHVLHDEDVITLVTK